MFQKFLRVIKYFWVENFSGMKKILECLNIFEGFKFIELEKAIMCTIGVCLGPQIQKYHPSKICGLRQTQCVRIIINL